MVRVVLGVLDDEFWFNRFCAVFCVLDYCFCDKAFRGYVDDGF